MPGMKVVTADEMARIDALAIQNGCDEEKFVLAVGKCVCLRAIEWIQQHHLAKKIVILAGKGHKGADALAAGILLLQKGFAVQAYHLSKLDQCKPLCKKLSLLFRKKGGQLIEIHKASDIVFGKDHLIVDGLLGTGCSGAAQGLYREVIEIANASGLDILAVDIPSGLNGSTGEAAVAIQAALTVALGLPKIGFFLKNGWNFVGQLFIEDFGLPPEYIKRAEASAYLPDFTQEFMLPKIKRNRHKYQAGLVIGFAGSVQYSGAAKLSAFAALRSGAGIVKLFYPLAAESAMADTPYEIIRMPWEENAFEDAAKKASSIFIGPGLGRSESTLKLLKKIIPSIERPLVLDAEALQSDIHFPKNCICTPHAQEMLRLLGVEKLDEEELLKRSQKFCEKKNVIVLLKGAPTWILIPKEKPFIITHGDPGMATAGSGDVLTGILASLLAQGCRPAHAAILGATLHALSGEAAAKEKTSYCMIASDLIEYLPQAFCALKNITF